MPQPDTATTLRIAANLLEERLRAFEGMLPELAPLRAALYLTRRRLLFLDAMLWREERKERRRTASK